MKKKSAALVALIVLSIIQTLPIAHADSSNYPITETPALTWAKDLDSGYISTTPLLAGGLVIVKTPAGLFAFMQSDGTEIWNYSFVSEIQFEMSSLLLHTASKSNDVFTSPDLVITGWSSGEITAHRLIDGRLHWSVNTTAPAYGIQGELTEVPANNEILVPIETGIISLNPNNGNENWKMTFSDNARGYRHSATFWYENQDTWYVTGNENGHLTMWNSTNPEQATTIDFEITNGKIRSSMLVLNPRELLIPIQSNNGSVLIHWKDDVREDHHVMIGSFGIMTMADNNVIVPTSHNTTWWEFNNSLQYRVQLTNQPVTGKVESLGFEMFALPINTEQGKIEVYRLNISSSTTDLAWVWTPSVSNYMISGLGHDKQYNALAISNDAGRMEIAINSWLHANNEYKLWADRLAEWQSQSSGNPINFEYENLDSQKNSAPMLIGLGLALAIFSGLLVRIDRRPQIPFAFAATLILIGIILLIPEMQGVVDETLREETDRKENLLWPDSWNGLQVIGFEFGDPYLPGQYANNITLVDYDGTIIASYPAEDKTPTVWVGGLSGAQNGYELTSVGCEVADLEFEYHEESIGGYVDSIGYAVDGVDDQWLLYWVDGVHANLAIDAKSIDEDAVLIWYYL